MRTNLTIATVITWAVISTGGLFSTAHASTFRCAPGKHARVGDSASQVVKRCGQPLLVYDGIGRKGQPIQFWRYVHFPEGSRNGAVLEFHDGKVRKMVASETSSFKCSSSRRAFLGDTTGAVFTKCGQPSHTQTMRSARGKEFEEWFYLRGNHRRNVLPILTFTRDTLIAIEYRREGYR